MRQAKNEVFIEGILNEINLEKTTYNKNGQQTECIRGTFTIKVPQVNNGIPQDTIIPVHVFANKYTKDGKPSPSYGSFETMMNEYKSIAMSSEEEADRIRITRGTIAMNEYYRDGVLRSSPRIQSNFVSRLTRELDAQATFDTEIFVLNMKYRTDNEGIEVEPKVLEVTAALPQYNDKVDVITLTATTPDVINGIEQCWLPNTTVRAQGNLSFTVKTEEYQVSESAFGAPVKRKRTTTTNDLVITTGSMPYDDGETEFDANEIKNGLLERKQRLENEKTKEKVKAAPAANATTSDFGF